MARLRESIIEVCETFGMLWYWGSFPLSFVTYTAVIWLAIGFIMGGFL